MLAKPNAVKKLGEDLEKMMTRKVEKRTKKNSLVKHA